jgi:hypothetical protein
MYISLAISSFYDIFTGLLTEANPISKGGKRCQIILKRAAMVARNLLLKICANLIEFLNKIIFSDIRHSLSWVGTSSPSSMITSPAGNGKDSGYLAIDGSTIKVPRTKDCADHFGAWNPAKGEPCPLARISTLFDTLNGIVVDAVIRPKEQGKDILSDHALIHLVTYKKI